MAGVSFKTALDRVLQSNLSELKDFEQYTGLTKENWKQILTNKNYNIELTDNDSKAIEISAFMTVRDKDRNKRTTTTLPKFIVKLLKRRKKPVDRTDIINKFCSKLVEDRLSVKVLRGKEMIEFLDNDKGYSSCMRGKFEKYGVVYAENPDVFSVVVATENGTSSRTIVLGDKYYSYIYGSGVTYSAVVKYCKDNKITKGSLGACDIFKIKRPSNGLWPAADFGGTIYLINDTNAIILIGNLPATKYGTYAHGGKLSEKRY